jgi:ABC-2 type transport system ATP-binding protein
VDAIAAGTLKAMLQRFTARGGTIFLTSHVLEVVERLCSHIAIIQHGKLVTSGSIEELRAGVKLRDPERQGQALTLEQIFLEVVGGKAETPQELSWL